METRCDCEYCGKSFIFEGIDNVDIPICISCKHKIMDLHAKQIKKRKSEQKKKERG